MLQQPTAEDFVIATGETHSVKEFLERAFGCLGLDWRDYVKVEPKYFRPAEVPILHGDASKARAMLEWRPRVLFNDLVRMMVDADMELALQEKTLRKAGHTPAART